jgi:FkbM family methyltransferase
MELVDGHYIDTESLRPGDHILDAGCRGFSLFGALKGDYKFICLDPDPDIVPVPGVEFLQAALLTFNGNAKYCGWSTGEGNYIYKDEAPHYADKDIWVPCTTIDMLMKMYKVDQFGLAKFDIEGSEYELLLSIKWPFARQVAVEFHQACGHNKFGTHEQYINKLMNSTFGKLYEIAHWYEYKECPGLYEYLFKLRV